MGLKKAYDELLSNPEFSDGATFGNTIDLQENSIVGLDTIADATGVDRIDVSSSNTRIISEGGNIDNSLRINSSINSAIRTTNGWKLVDTNGNFDAYRYTSTSSSPGRLDLTNSLLNLHQTTSDPASSSIGDVWYRSDLD